jgi:Leucine-rich repeat (LRR) protein
MKYPIVVKGKTIKQVTKLNLSGKNLKEIPENVYDYTNLEKLDLSHNQIASIPQAILKLRKLRTIDLSFNKISVLQSSIFKLPKLRVLNLHGNEIQNLPKQVKDSHLKILILSKNKFEENPEELLHSIAKVDLVDNPIKIDKSEHQMEEVQNSMKETLSKENGYKKLNIFISYSHEDKDYLNRLQIHVTIQPYPRCTIL